MSVDIHVQGIVEIKMVFECLKSVKKRCRDEKSLILKRKQKSFRREVVLSIIKVLILCPKQL